LRGVIKAHVDEFLDAFGMKRREWLAFMGTPDAPEVWDAP
jgi:hypothetical protein